MKESEVTEAEMRSVKSLKLEPANPDDNTMT